MLRLADRKADRGLARRGVAEQLAQPHERRARIRRANGAAETGSGTDSRVILYIMNSGTTRRITGLR